MKLLLLLLLLTLPAWAVKINVECFGDEIIIATAKHTNELKGAYICKKELKIPVAIIYNENFDDKLDTEDSIALYVSDTYKGNRAYLKEKFEDFNRRFKEYKKQTREKDAYFQIDFKELDGQLEVADLLRNVGSKTYKAKEDSNEFYDDTDESAYRKRFYDPKVQRFLSPDPKGFAAGDPNFYRYTGNNPILYNDPFGLDFRICSRPLNMSLPDAEPFKHYYIRFKDGSTISYGVDENDNPSELTEPSKPKGESCGNNIQSTPQEDSLMKKWANQNYNTRYDPYGYNCKSFIGDATTKFWQAQ